MTTRPDLTEARDALLERLEEWLLHDVRCAINKYGHRCDCGLFATLNDIALARAEATDANERLRGEVERLTADLKVFTEEPGILERMGSEYTTYWYNAYLSERRRAEAGGVSVEALRQAFLDIEYPEVFADGESRRLSAALAARSAGSGSRVERVRREQAAGGGPVTAVMVSRTTEYATGGNPRPTPPPAVDVHALAESASAQRATKVDAEYHALRAARPTPPPAVDGTREHRWQDCTAGQDCPQPQCNPDDDGNCRSCGNPFIVTPPAPDDRLRALEAALAMTDDERLVRRSLAVGDRNLFEARTMTILETLDAARALLGSDGEGSRS